MGKGFESDPHQAANLADGVIQHQGHLDATGLRFGIVSGRFNPDLVQALVKAASDRLIACGARPEDIEVAWVPGAFEVSTVLERWGMTGRFDALIGMGTVIQGKTSHAEVIGEAVAASIQLIARTYQLPVIDTIVVAPSYEIAEPRCVGPESRGTYAAAAAIEMAQLMKNV